MATIQWRPEVNALTTPQSYKILHVPHDSVGYEDMAHDISAEQPLYSPETINSLAPLIMQWIQEQLINGRQVTFPEAFTFNVSFSGRLDSPDDPLPEDDNLLHVNVRVSQPFVKEIRHQARLERLPMTEKAPVISSTEDTKLKLADVLNPEGVLHLIGSNLDFDESNPDCGCTIAGSQSGSIKQNLYAAVSNSSVLLVPDIPDQAHPWNNEYTVSLTTQYSKHGTLRTGTCRRRLRSPLTVLELGHVGPETGILTGGDVSAPFVNIINGSTTANERLRIQAIIEALSGQLLFNILDMEEDGKEGAQIEVPSNGEYTLPSFSGSAVSSLTVRVDNHAALLDLIRNIYTGRLVDILDIEMA